MTFIEIQGESVIAHVTLIAFVVFMKMHDPLAWGAVLGALLLGGTRQPWWSALPLAAGSTICDLALWQLRDGILGPRLGDAGGLLVVFCIICGIGWVFGRSAAWLARKANGRPVTSNSEEGT